jgi:sulfur carrier protein
MNISFNSEVQELPDESLLIQLLETKQLDDKKGIAVAVNGNVVPRDKWAETLLINNDAVLVIKAAQGG